MLGWVVVTEKLVAVPVVLQTTPPEPVKPGSPLHAPEALYVLLSTKYASWAVAALRASDATRALKPRDRYAENCGIAIAARMPMMATTTSSSISVKPLDFFRFILETLRILCPITALRRTGRHWHIAGQPRHIVARLRGSVSVARSRHERPRAAPSRRSRAHRRTLRLRGPSSAWLPVTRATSGFRRYMLGAPDRSRRPFKSAPARDQPATLLTHSSPQHVSSWAANRHASCYDAP